MQIDLKVRGTEERLHNSVVDNRRTEEVNANTQ